MLAARSALNADFYRLYLDAMAIRGKGREAAAVLADALGLTGSNTTMWNGQLVNAFCILTKYTYGADANLDGKITISDYGKIDFNVGIPGASGWANGDFNYDGKINISDYGIIDFNIGIQGPPL